MASSQGASLPQASESGSPLRDIFDMIAGTDAQASAALEEEFDSYDDVVALAVADDDSLTDDVVSKLPSAKHKSRLRAVLKYISRGGKWRPNLSLSDINEFVLKSVTTASSGSVYVDDGPSKHAAVEPKADGVSSASSSRIDGGTDWTVVDSLFDGLEIRVNIAELKYSPTVQQSIKQRLEEKLGAQLNISKTLSTRPLRDGTGRSELYFQLRCKGYYSPKTGDEKCPFTVEVATVLDEAGETIVCIIRLR